MKLYKFLLYSLPIIGAFSCTTVEKIEVEHIGGYNTMENAESEAYYASLREYRKQMRNYKRPVAFGWFSDWAPQGASRKGYLSSVPDSMDIISMWSGAPSKKDITEEQRRDKEFVQKKKGIKLLEVSLLSHLGKGRTPESIYEPLYKKAKEENWDDKKLEKEKKFARWDYWGFTSHDVYNFEELKAAHTKFAKALCDGLYENEWDGFDIDWEPGVGFNDSDHTLAANPREGELFNHLVKEMSKYIGPKSQAAQNGEDYKLFCVDGHYWDLDKDNQDAVDYFIIQSYGGCRDINSETPWKFILTENFESFAHNGGAIHRQAKYNPDNGPKGGVGAYRFTKDYDNNPTYYHMRTAIQENLASFKEKFPKWDGAPTSKPENNE